MATRMFLIICLLYGKTNKILKIFFCSKHFVFALVGLTGAKDIDFGAPNTCTLQNKECQVDFKVDCQSELTGFILSPNFPNLMNSTQSGKVKKSRTAFRVIVMYFIAYIIYFYKFSSTD